MLGAGTVINPIIKIVTTVAILAAVYFFIVKPTLDTTNTAFESVTDSFDGFDDLSGDVQSQVEDAFDSTSDSGRLEDVHQPGDQRQRRERERAHALRRSLRHLAGYAARLPNQAAESIPRS